MTQPITATAEQIVHDKSIIEKSDLVSEFLGGIIQDSLTGGTIVKFDEPETPTPIMVCPPFGFVARTNDAGQLLLRYHEDWNWLMRVIQKCALTQSNSELKHLYYLIIEDVRNSLPIELVFESVLTFVDTYLNSKQG